MVKNKENRLVVADTGWAEDVPEWLKAKVAEERIALGLAAIKDPALDGMVGDAEACLYLFTRALVAPMGSELSEIYIYLAAKLAKQRNPNAQLEDFMEAKLKKGLTEWEQHELDDLKRTLYSERGGKIRHPILDDLRARVQKISAAEREREKTGQTLLPDFSGQTETSILKAEAEAS